MNSKTSWKFGIFMGFDVFRQSESSQQVVVYMGQDKNI